jgi:hypothetical protein
VIAEVGPHQQLGLEHDLMLGRRALLQPFPQIAQEPALLVVGG